MCSKYNCYPEYHTSLDNFDLVTASGLLGGYNVLQKVLEIFENNEKIKSKIIGEPQLGKRGLYPSQVLKSNLDTSTENMLNLLAYADGHNSLLEIAEIINTPIWDLYKIVKTLKKFDIIE